MAWSQFLINKLIDHWDGKTAYAQPTVFVGLSTTTPTNTGTNVTEPSTGSYARVTTSGATWVASSAGSAANAAAITFPTATGDWSAAANQTNFVLYDASSAGNFLGFGTLTVAKSVLNGDTAQFAIGALTISAS